MVPGCIFQCRYVPNAASVAEAISLWTKFPELPYIGFVDQVIGTALLLMRHPALPAAVGRSCPAI